jgi:hypothetical protein
MILFVVKIHINIGGGGSIIRVDAFNLSHHYRVPSYKVIKLKRSGVPIFLDSKFTV